MVKYKKGIGEKTFDALNVVFMFLLMATILAPFVYMFAVSISDYREVGLMNVWLVPKGIQWNSYKTVFTDPKLLTAARNSVVYTVVGTVMSLLIQGLCAYTLSRPNFKYRRFFTLLMLMTMYFNGGMIPGYLNMKSLHLLDTMWSIILPGTFAMYNIVLMRTSFSAIPGSLIESAYIDGANDWYIFFRIIVPLSKAIIATIAVFAGVQYWNAYFNALLYITSEHKEPLTILLRRVLISGEATDAAVSAASMAAGENSFETDPVLENGAKSSIKMATVFVTVVPILVIYPFAQKYFVKGVMVGSVKG